MSLAEVEAFAMRILRANGLADHQAGPIARAMAAAEASDCRSHGLYRLIGYVGSIRSGRVSAAARPRLERIAGSFLRVDGDNGFAPAAHAVGVVPLIDAAKHNGIAALALTHCYHFSALWHDLAPIVDAGLACWAFTVGQCIVAPHGGNRRLMGTNPIAFGWPRAGQRPFMLDFATSAVARGEVELMGRAGKSLPPGWGIDAAGESTLDPAEALAGALLPFGGYKGSALSMMVELIAGPLIGEPTSRTAAALDNGDGGPPLGGELLIAMSPGVFNSGLTHDCHEQAEAFFAQAREQPGVRLPSDRRHAARERSLQCGVEVSDALLKELTHLVPGA
jgi:LDH2 family malate/lactate/ureidoglycolate dehydrogenase